MLPNNNNKSNMLKCLPLHHRAKLPKRASPFSAGLDLFALEDGVVECGGMTKIRTGIAVEIPDGCYGRIAPRSSLARDFKINVMAGVIDSDYRGEIIIMLINHGNKEDDDDDDFYIEAGDAVAQLIIEKIKMLEPRFVDHLEDTERGVKGFGSSDS